MTTYTHLPGTNGCVADDQPALSTASRAASRFLTRWDLFGRRIGQLYRDSLRLSSGPGSIKSLLPYQLS